ncbi:MAG: hypothetical protein JJE04_01505 [Acidobacteriia bacterium]|nr:hypothetical protein [Terriglobia bacterium]
MMARLAWPNPLPGGEGVGNHGFRGATTFLPQLEAPILLTAAPAADFARIRHIPHVLARRAFSPVGSEVLRGGALNPRVKAEPHVFAYQFSRFSG